MHVDKTRLCLAAMLAALCSLHLGCIMPAQCRNFFDLPRDQAKAQFRSYPIEKQVDIYMCGMDIEPPMIELAQEIADKGDDATLYLLQRLKTEQNESNQEKIIYIFRWMADRGELRNKREIIEQLKLVNSGMKDNFYKVRSQQFISQMEQ